MLLCQLPLFGPQARDEIFRLMELDTFARFKDDKQALSALPLPASPGAQSL